MIGVGTALALAGVSMTAHAMIRVAMHTGRPELDRHADRLAMEALLAFGPAALQPEIPRALMAILNNESAGMKAPVVGDRTPEGPSIGPMQVHRKTATAMGLYVPQHGATEWESRAAYEALAHDDALGIRWGVLVFKEKLRIGGTVHAALKLYNGSGPAAEAYRSRALTFYAKTWGPFPEAMA